MRVLLLLVVLAGCEDEPTIVFPESFERAEQVAFACIDVTLGVGLPVESCDEAATEDLRLHALVTQTARGELAIVDLGRNTLVDVATSVPGFTFHPVGEEPTSVAVSPDGTRAYVANHGSRSISVFEVSDLRSASNGPPGEFPLDFAPYDLAAQAARLFVTAPEEGLLIAMDADTGELVGQVALAATPPPTGGDAGVDGGEADAGADGGQPDAAGDEGPELKSASLPWRIEPSRVPDEPVLYVSNAGRPFVSVVDTADLTEQDLIDVGAPTTDLAVSPPDQQGQSLWLYAVERGLGGVRVVDLAAKALLDVNRGTAIKRIDDPATPSVDESIIVEYDNSLVPGPALEVPGVARAVDIFERAGEDSAGPSMLDGVFAAVASSDGRVYYVDIEDRDAALRAEAEAGYVFIPHHLRSARALTPNAMPSVASNPTILVETTAAVCATDWSFVPHFWGRSGGEPPPCDDAGKGILVGGDYPWQSEDQTWTVAFEGVIPGTRRPRGNLQAEGELLDRGADFCALGVRPGDRAVITTRLEPTRSGADCPEAQDLAFRIAEVRATLLVLAEPFDFDLAACGAAEWVDYEVRASGEWVVVGSQSGFLHATVEDEEARCLEPEGSDPRLSGRAAECPASEPDCAFENPFVAFTMIRASLGSSEGTTWTFTTTNELVALSTEVGDLPSAVAHVSTRDALFAVDPADTGLVEVDVGDLSVRRNFE